MSKVILLCGKICSGKSTYAEELRRKMRAAVLSVDEITLALFGQDIGERHDEFVAALEGYIFEKSVQLIGVGIDVVMDIGLWTRAERAAAREYYRAREIECELHYIDVSVDEWAHRIDKRNREVSNGRTSAYFVDEGLAKKVASLFEAPEKSEVDVYII